ncbi:MAG TPA: DUF5990 family protein [Armatimonadota bacterium]|jgi:hypothetical protein
MAGTPRTEATIGLRLIAEQAPPEEHSGRRAQFGLKDKKLQYHPHLPQPDGTVRFDVEVLPRESAPSSPPRFSGPYVLGKPTEQYIGLVWYYADDSVAIRGQKIRLDTLPWKLVDQAAHDPSLVIKASVVPVTERTATIPVEWSLVPR